MADSQLLVECNHCHGEYPYTFRTCPTCQVSNPFAPNVKAALAEFTQLEGHYTKALEQNRAHSQRIQAFENACGKSHVVLNIPLDQLIRILSNPHQLYVNWYQKTGSGTTLPEGNQWDVLRQDADNRLFGNYKDDVYFGCLSLDQLGVLNYGSYTLVLKNEAVSWRVSVFHGNSATWVQKYKRNKKLPKGFRAAWRHRQLLCVAKEAARVGASSLPPEHPSHLLVQGPDTNSDDFVEAHIFRSFNRGAIAKVVVGKPVTPFELALVTEKLKSLNIEFEDRS